MARGLTLVAVAVAVLATACASDPDPTLAPGTVEAALAELAWPDDPALVADIECARIDAEVIAQSTACTATIDGEPVNLEVDVDPEGRVGASIREPLFALADAAGQLAARLAADLGIAPPTVECERDVVLSRAGTEIACTATHDGAPIDFVFRLLDAEGRWTLEIVP